MAFCCSGGRHIAPCSGDPARMARCPSRECIAPSLGRSAAYPGFQDFVGIFRIAVGQGVALAFNAEVEQHMPFLPVFIIEPLDDFFRIFGGCRNRGAYSRERSFLLAELRLIAGFQHRVGSAGEQFRILIPHKIHVPADSASYQQRNGAELTVGHFGVLQLRVGCGIILVDETFLEPAMHDLNERFELRLNRAEFDFSVFLIEAVGNAPSVEEIKSVAAAVEIEQNRNFVLLAVSVRIAVLKAL